MKRVWHGRTQITDSNGDPLVGAKLEFFAAGTTNQLDTYSDYALTTANTNPVITDSGGWVTIYLTPNVFYDYTTKTSDDVTVYDKELNVYAYQPPLTTKGDVFTFDTDFQRLPVGADGLFLVADSAEATGLNWGSGSDNTLTTKGDLYTYSTANARLPVGADGSLLIANSSEATGLEWVSGQARASNSTGTSAIAEYTWTTVAFDTELQDDDGVYDNSTYTYTAAAAGWYAVDARTDSGGVTDTTQLRILVDSTRGISSGSVHDGVDGNVAHLSILVRLAAAETFIIQWRHFDSTNSKSISSGGYLNIRRVS